MDPKLVPAIVKEAHAQGMRVSGHIPAGMLAQDAVNAGFDEIQHVNFLFLNFMPDTMNATQTPIRLTATAQRAGTIDLQSRPVKDFIALLKSKGYRKRPYRRYILHRYDDAHGRPCLDRICRDRGLVAGPGEPDADHRRATARARTRREVSRIRESVSRHDRLTSRQRHSHRRGNRRRASRASTSFTSSSCTRKRESQTRKCYRRRRSFRRA